MPMEGNSYAVLIGIDKYKDPSLVDLRYAEKDCRDLHRVLTDPEIGNFESENATLLLGQNATKQKIEEELYRNVVKNRKPEDIVLVTSVRL